jgi:hypothetical protein
MSERYARDEHAQEAAIERLWSHTVGITNRALARHGTDPDSGLPAREEEAVGTGVAAMWAGHHFVLTAKHVLDKAGITDLALFPRPPGSFTQAIELTAHMAFAPRPIKDTRASIYRCDWEDLALITLHPSELGPYTDFCNLSQNWIDPPQGEWVLGLGYPVSSAPIFGRRVGKVLEKGVALTPIGFSGEVLPSSTGTFFKQFDAERHFLIPYEVAGTGNHHPEGISGAALWLQSKGKQFVWTPKFEFAGICTSCYRDGTVEQIVKASAVRQFLADTFGPAD